MHHNNITANTPNEIVDLFADYFESIYDADDRMIYGGDIVQCTAIALSHEN